MHISRAIVKFQKEATAVGGVAPTRYLLLKYFHSIRADKKTKLKYNKQVKIDF